MKLLKLFSSLIFLFSLMFGSSGCLQAFALGMAMPNPWLVKSKGPPSSYWFKSEADIEQIKQDYGECRYKEKSCMEGKGYTWLSSDRAIDEIYPGDESQWSEGDADSP